MIIQNILTIKINLVKHAENNLNKRHFSTRDPYMEYNIMKATNPQNLAACEQELARVSREVVLCFTNNLPFSSVLMENPTIGYALKPEFLITFFEVLILNGKNISHWIDLDDVGLLDMDQTTKMIRINAFWQENYNAWIATIPPNASVQLSGNFKDDTSSSDTEVESDYEWNWNWKKIAVIAVFGLYILKEVIAYFYSKKEENKSTQIQDEKKTHLPKENEENSLKSIFEEFYDTTLVEFMLKLIVPYSIYMLYNFRYYLYYKYFKK